MSFNGALTLSTLKKKALCRTALSRTFHKTKTCTYLFSTFETHRAEFCHSQMHKRCESSAFKYTRTKYSVYIIIRIKA